VKARVVLPLALSASPAARRRAGRDGRANLNGMLDPLARTEVTLEPLDDFVVIQPLEDSETATGLIVPMNEAAQCLTGIIVAVGPDVSLIEPGDKVLYPREAGFEVRLVRSAHRVRVVKREELIARVHD
jgi:co-chaperonin GroES (HSP10)